MKKKDVSLKLKTNPGKFFILLALILLTFSSIFGVLGSLYYVFPGYLEPYLGFEKLRPMHVSAAVFWILSAATGFIYVALEQLGLCHKFRWQIRTHLLLWILALALIFISYALAKFGGREYWEFPPFIALIIAAAWLIFFYVLIKSALKIKPWPVYFWMWTTGVVFFFFIFIENYLWIHPYFRTDFLKDMLIQWKAAGSLVGAWNMLIYGSAIYLMERINKDQDIARNKWAFALFFLSLFNMLFNWGHHLYLVPVHPVIHYTGYIVSMTEWIFLIKIFYTWKSQLTEAKSFYQYYPYRYLLAANIWVCLNLVLALLMSIPVFNLYLHGTHIIVAHAMGTTIGINSMILIACILYVIQDRRKKPFKYRSSIFWSIQLTLLGFLCSLLFVGWQKAYWRYQLEPDSFSMLMERLSPYFAIMITFGVGLSIALLWLVYQIFKGYFSAKIS